MNYQANRDSDAAAVDPQSPAKTANVRTLRVWPAIVLLVTLWGLRIIPRWFDDVPMPLMMAQFMGPAACAALLLIWWVFLSRAPVKEKLLGLLGVVIIGGVTTVLADKSILGFGTIIYSVPWGVSAFAAALICLGWMTSARRTVIALLAALIAFGFWDLVRNDGVWGDFRGQLSWRWEPTAEDRFMQQLATRSASSSSLDEAQSEPLDEPQWPAFRGPRRDNVLPEAVLKEDWISDPPQELWRIEVGPGWSSFSVAGNRVFTQEQRGENEAIVCLDAQDGSQRWAHEYPSRFWEAVGGAGPRATPTISDGKLFALGAQGILYRLDPLSGEPVWQRDLKADAAREPPMWGFSSSPLVVDGRVVVHAGGAGDKGVLAYDVESGDLAWSAPAGDHSYSSPQLARIADTRCILMLTNAGLSFIDPTNGATMGSHAWGHDGYRVVQPLLIDSSTLLLGTNMGTGTRRIDVQVDADEIVTAETWTSRHMKPDYNDYVAHNGYLYGFDHTLFACIDLETGKRKWKKGRYGNGQVLLLPREDQLLVISESGELVLLHANPDKLDERARCKVLEGKTWNHPVLVGSRLFVRNSEQAACFQMPLVDADGSADSLQITSVTSDVSPTH